MPPGPRKTPTIELSSWRKDMEARKKEVQVARLESCPSPPRWLHPRARKFWKPVAGQLHAAGLLTELDLVAVGVLCDRLELVERCTRKIERNELVYQGTGGQKANPLFRVLDSAVADCRRLFADLGLTPSARIGLPKADDRPGGIGSVGANGTQFPKG